MESFLNAESTMAILFVIVALGFMARKLEWMDDRFDAALSRLIMNISCPALVLSSVLCSESLPEPGFIAYIVLISVVVYIPILVLAWVGPKVYRVPRGIQGNHQFTIAFGNTGFIGFAVVGAIIGSTAVLYASLYNIVFNLLVYSVGASFVARTASTEVVVRGRVKKALRSLCSPTMISCVVALVLALLGVTDVHGVVGRSCNMLGAMTPPASMLVLGSTLAKYDFRSLFGDWRMYLTALLRLLGVPAIVFLVGGFMTSDSYLLASLTLENAMPAAALGTIFCLTYNGDLESMSRATLLTTVFSVATIPLVSLVVL